MKARILIIGNTYLENEFFCHDLPAVGYPVTADEYGESIGGRGAEAALAAGKLAGNAILLGRCGADSNGKRIRDFLRARGVDVRFYLDTPEEKTAVNVCMRRGTDSAQLYYPGASRRLSMKDAERAFSCSPEAVYINFDFPHEIAVTSSRFAAMRRIPVFLSLSPVRKDFPFDLLEGVDTVFADEQEVRRYTGISTASVEGCMKATIELTRKTGARCIVIKRAEKGIYFSTGKYYNTIPAYALKPVDEQFADAAFDVAFITHYVEHKIYEQACEYASIVGALTASREGKLVSVPDQAQVMEFAQVNCPQLCPQAKNDADDF